MGWQMVIRNKTGGMHIQVNSQFFGTIGNLKSTRNPTKMENKIKKTCFRLMYTGWLIIISA